MPDFTAVEGGGHDRNWEHEIARQHFEQFCLALLRSIASGERVYQLVEDFFAFFKHAKETGIPIRPVFEEGVSGLRERAFDLEGASTGEAKRIDIAQAALRFIAAKASTDNRANARRSRRRRELDEVIESAILEGEVGSSGRGRRKQSRRQARPPKASRSRS